MGPDEVQSPRRTSNKLIQHNAAAQAVKTMSGVLHVAAILKNVMNRFKMVQRMYLFRCNTHGTCV
jgi:hypothetical protein